MDPFFNECRAFGRIIEAGLNGKIAVECYGYLAISPKLEGELQKKFNVSKWRRPEQEYKKPFSRRQPFRAIVKALLPTGNPPLYSKNVRKALRDLKKMNKLGVYSLDIRVRNYVSGILVDLGLAITEEHYLFYISPPWRVRLYQKEDLEHFDGMVEELGINTWERALPNEAYLSKLRSGKELREDRRLESAVRTWELIEQADASEAPSTAQGRRNKATPAEAKRTAPPKKNLKSTKAGASTIKQRGKRKTRTSHAKAKLVSQHRRLGPESDMQEASPVERFAKTNTSTAKINRPTRSKPKR